MQRLRTVTALDVSAVAGHHAMPAMLLFSVHFDEIHPTVKLYSLITHRSAVMTRTQTFGKGRKFKN